MNAESNQRWVERMHRGRLGPDDVAKLREQAERAGDGDAFAEELALEDCLGRLPQPEVSSNFTAQVMAAIEREERSSKRRRPGWAERLRRLVWRPQVIFAGAAGLALVVTWQFRVFERQRLAEDVVMVIRAAEAPQAAQLSGVETLQDFDAIQLATPRPKVDYVGLVNALTE